MNQKGFATLEVILMIVIIGILATVAIPRFGDMKTKANTAKIQADLSTLDSAIEIYFMENGTYPDGESITTLKDYIKDVDNLKPPTGKAYINGTATDIKATDYAITENTTTKDYRATLDTHTVGDFSLTKKTTTNGAGQ